MMEKLGAPQTHLGLKAMIKEVGKRQSLNEFILQKYILIPSFFQVDEDDDSAISFREFLMIFRKARLGELDMESGLGKLASLSEVDVDAVGVGGAKTFFEAKVKNAEQTSVLYTIHSQLYLLLTILRQIAEVSKGSKFAEEIKEEQEERKREEEVAPMFRTK